VCLISHFILSLTFCLVGFACQYPNSGIRAFLVGVVNTQELFVYTVTIHVYDTTTNSEKDRSSLARHISTHMWFYDAILIRHVPVTSIIAYMVA
jgi:hypothetical protein